MERTWMRRDILAGGGIALAARLAGADAPLYAYVGCFTTAERHGRGDGIHVYRMDPGSGAWTHVQRMGDLVNPSFLALSRDRRFLYSAHGDESYASVFTVDRASGQ